MLDQETKRKIDSTRDILVGKVPDPKAQVEQITIALMYKFMEDMDKASQKLGGKSRFFTKDFEKYSWSYLLDPRTGGFDRINLYSEALVKMSQNPALPQLFRDIFKGAFLPYRDPETLNLFLKEINSFQYDHSERLGDSFEYLLSVLGSQGEAGQFRTPRHIIDFMVEIMGPQKDETVLDPACGTAGFLIFAYKHILKNNMKKNPGDKLTPAEKEKIMNHFTGYDISPDMVRLSRVNMYLHGFQTPYIYEYDTLTSEDKWQETADVILANPPFMTPKGGIRPHKRFSVQANRSEVLFVDYMAEHLNVNGRAGIIVPEGIIFQSSNAYKALRKMLIENYLYAVVSLPAGAFNPYSGVKTSILLLDKVLAKKTKDILFVKIENDGFNLGAQRRAIDQNDLPEALKIIKEYQKTFVIASPSSVIASEAKQSLCHLVPKQKISDSGDYNLSGDRYKETPVITNHKWQILDLGEVCNIYNGSTPSRSNIKFWEDGTVPWFTIDDIREQGRFISITKQKITEKALKETSVKLLPINTVLLCCTASIGEYALSKIKLTTNQQFNGLVIREGYEDKLLPEFLFWISSLFKSELIRLSGKTSFHFISVGTLKKFKISLPPLEIQQQIISELDNYQKIIDSARQIIKTFRPTIQIEKEWDIINMGNKEVVEIIDGDRGVNYPKKNEFKKSGYCVFLNTKNVTTSGFIFDEVDFISQERDIKLRKGKLQRNDVVLTTRGTVGNSAFYNESVEFNHIRINSGMVVLRSNSKKIMPEFLWRLVQSDFVQGQFKQILSGTAQPQLPIRNLISTNLPLPSIDIQKGLIIKIREEQKLIEANKKIIEIFEKKIKDKITEVWGL